jgi:hypothetical protein
VIEAYGTTHDCYMDAAEYHKVSADPAIAKQDNHDCGMEVLLFFV